MPRGKILVVDDEVNTLLVLRRILEEEHTVYTALSGEEGLARFRANPIDLVITDQRMPGMSGVDMLSAMRRINPECIRIVLSAYADFDAVLRAVNQGDVYRYVLKPWNSEEMLVTVRHALEHQEAVRARERLTAELMEKNRQLEQATAELCAAQSAAVRTEKLAAIGKLAGNVLHAVNNQLFVMNMVGIYKERYPEDRGLAEVLDSITGVKEIVTDMLDSYRYYVKGAGASLALLEHDVAQLVAEAVSAARMTDYANGRVIDMSGAEHVRCMCDRQKIKQVLMHLIRNGCEAVPQRGRVAVTVTKEAEDMVIAVTDDGPGIAPERMEKIWEPFYSTKTESGLGLGLDLCRSIIEWHRGTIQCRSEPGCGATFTVRLPREVTTE